MDSSDCLNFEQKTFKMHLSKWVIHAVGMVDHWGNAVKSEPIKLILINPPAQIGKQESLGLNPKHILIIIYGLQY